MIIHHYDYHEVHIDGIAGNALSIIGELQEINFNGYYYLIVFGLLTKIVRQVHELAHQTVLTTFKQS